MTDSTDRSAPSGAASRYDDWEGRLDPGFTGVGCRLFVHGRYNLGMRCGGKVLRHLKTDFSPTLFTIDVVDAPGDGGDWITLSSDFEAPESIREVMLDDGEEKFTFPVDRSRIDGAEAGQRLGGQSGIPCPFGGNRSWAAHVDRMPGSPATLIVAGEVLVGSDGYVGRLTPTVIEEIQPPNQVFELTLVESRCGKAGWQPVASHTAAAYDEYGLAVILCHGEELARIEVHEID